MKVLVKFNPYTAMTAYINLDGLIYGQMKTELLYNRYDTKQMTVEDLKELIWRYFSGDTSSVTGITGGSAQPMAAFLL